MSVEKIFYPNAIEIFFGKEVGRVKDINVNLHLGEIKVFTERGNFRLERKEGKWQIYREKGKKNHFYEFEKDEELTEKINEYLSKLNIKKEDIEKIDYSYGEFKSDYDYEEINLRDRKVILNVEAKIEGKGEYRLYYYKNDYKDIEDEGERGNGIFEGGIKAENPKRRMEKAFAKVRKNADLIKFYMEFWTEKKDWWGNPRRKTRKSQGWIWKNERYEVYTGYEGIELLAKYLKAKGFDEKLSQFILNLAIENQTIPEDLKLYADKIMEVLNKNPTTHKILIKEGLTNDFKLEIWEVKPYTGLKETDTIFNKARIYTLKDRNDKVLILDYYGIARDENAYENLIGQIKKVELAKDRSGKNYVIFWDKEGNLYAFKVLNKRQPKNGLERKEAKELIELFTELKARGEWQPIGERNFEIIRPQIEGENNLTLNI